jgi:hypothetical protein
VNRTCTIRWDQVVLAALAPLVFLGFGVIQFAAGELTVSSIAAFLGGVGLGYFCWYLLAVRFTIANDTLTWRTLLGSRSASVTDVADYTRSMLGNGLMAYVQLKSGRTVPTSHSRRLQDWFDAWGFDIEPRRPWFG